ncbi:hypothetical protein ACH5RR_000396 [Cinchona calisaya]|uniref:Uncharacterized protein n=1 Tax=Cinchona calisaya TaxID=153742 RepID=A0ABD3B0K1_9GENT
MWSGREGKQWTMVSHGEKKKEQQIIKFFWKACAWGNETLERSKSRDVAVWTRVMQLTHVTSTRSSGGASKLRYRPDHAAILRIYVRRNLDVLAVLRTQEKLSSTVQVTIEVGQWPSQTKCSLAFVVNVLSSF